MDGLLHAAPFADGISVVLTGIWYYTGIKQLTKEETLATVDYEG